MISLRKATPNDSDLLLHWANDPVTRKNSYHSAFITESEHQKWFENKIHDPASHIYIFSDDTSDTPVGMVQIEQKPSECVIGISVDKNWRGRSLGATMLQMACRKFLEEVPAAVIFAYIKTENVASFKSFERAGFRLIETISVREAESYKMEYRSE